MALDWAAVSGLVSKNGLTMTIARSLLPLVALTSMPGVGNASDQAGIAACPASDLGPGVVTIPSAADLPDEIRSELTDRFGSIAEKGQPFQASDVVDSGSKAKPDKSFIAAGRHENRYFIWFEHGGRGRHVHVVGYLLKGKMVTFEVNFVANPCAATKAFLDGVRPSLH